MIPIAPGIRRVRTNGPPGAVSDSGIVEALQADHAQLRALFERFTELASSENPPLPEVRERLAHCICDTLSSQRLAEQEVLYPEIRKENEKLVFAFLLADEGIAIRIAEILDRASPQFKRDLAVLRLMVLVRRYMHEREQVLFPFLRSRLPATCLEWLGADFAQRKSVHAAGVAGGWSTAPGRGGEGSGPYADTAMPHLASRAHVASGEVRN